MARRFFTADFHLGMSDILSFENRPFISVDAMNKHLLTTCIKQTEESDTIIHVGDLACFKASKGTTGLGINPQELISLIPATFINIHGNHDINNKVKSLGYSIQTVLGKRFKNVTIGHYPSYDVHAKDIIREGWIHLCGHVHRKWKHCLDITHKILNINVGVDVWNYKLVSEEDLINYIDGILKLPKEKLNRVKVEGNKVIKIKENI